MTGHGEIMEGPARRKGASELKIKDNASPAQSQVNRCRPGYCPVIVHNWQLRGATKHLPPIETEACLWWCL